MFQQAKRRLTNVGQMLGRGRRKWAYNIEPTLVECAVFAGVRL